MIIELTKQPGKRLPQFRIWGGTVRELEKRTIKTVTPLIVKHARAAANVKGWETRRKNATERRRGINAKEIQNTMKPLTCPDCGVFPWEPGHGDCCARTATEVPVGEATAKQLWQVVFTLRNRAGAKARKGK